MRWPRRPWEKPWTPAWACRTLVWWSPLGQHLQQPSSLPGSWDWVRFTDFHHTKGCCLETYKACSPGSDHLPFLLLIIDQSPSCFQLFKLPATMWPVGWNLQIYLWQHELLQKIMHSHPWSTTSNKALSFNPLPVIVLLAVRAYPLNDRFKVVQNLHHLFSEFKQTELAMHFFSEI